MMRPQPVGILPIPAGLLVLPYIEDSSVELQRILHGDISGAVPSEWAFYESAAKGNFANALQQLAGVDTPEAWYNRFVLEPSAEDFAWLQGRLNGELRSLLDVAAYVSGLDDAEPVAGDLHGELLALVLMTKAAAAIEREKIPEAIDILQSAVEAAHEISPIFAVQLLAQMAALRKMQPEPLRSQARKHLKDAVELLGSVQMPELIADIYMQLGMACQESAQGRESWMNEAVHAYQQVLRGGLVPEEHRELFALAHNNLGLLFLTMPMSEASRHLRMGIAVQSFREGLRLCDREANPDLWASIQSNLANALQYLPSSHPQENLAQAVELYEELVSVGRKAFDPVGYGKILSNQANALAHLGIFSPALEKLQEARKLFEWHGESELATNALDQVANIHAQLGTAAGGELTMDLHERQQFDQLLQTAVERYVERLEQRNEGGENALVRLRADPQGEGIWLDRFVNAFFEDSLLNNTDGAAFVLRALPKRTIAPPPAGSVDSMLRAMAASAFGALLQLKTEEELERRMSFQAV